LPTLCRRERGAPASSVAASSRRNRPLPGPRGGKIDPCRTLSPPGRRAWPRESRRHMRVDQRDVRWTAIKASNSSDRERPRRSACRSARRMMSSNWRSMRCLRVTERRPRRCRREPNPNSCIGGGPVGSHGGAGRRQTAVGAGSRRQRPRHAWRSRWRSGLLVPSVGGLTTIATRAHRWATRPTPAASRMAVVTESSVAPPCDEVRREDTSLKHS
jgi:hypothetical protein